MEMHVIFYPSGYLQLQIADDGDDYCHIYDSPGKLAKDVSSLLDGDNAIGWYGNDPDAWLDIGHTSGIRHISREDIPEFLLAMASGKVDRSSLWSNEVAFYDELAKRRGISG